MKRRTYLTTVTGTGIGIAIAGCMGDDDPDDDSDPEDDAGDDAADEEEEEEEPEDTDESTPELAGTFDDFEDLDQWEAFVGSMEADTDRYYDGSQSALITPDDDGHVRVRRELDEPIDVTDVRPGIAVARNYSGTMLIQLQDANGDYLEYTQQVASDVPLMRLNFGPTRLRGDPDLSRVTLLQVISWFGEDVDGEAWIDDFHFVPSTSPGKVMLQFHGGHEGHYTEALPLLEEYDQQASAFIATDRVSRDSDRMSTDQIRELAEADWTIGSYSARGVHLDDVPSEDLESDIVDPISWLEREGYDDGARFFAFPGSRYDNDSYEIVQENYELAFAGRAPSQGYVANPHLCSQVSNPDPGEASELIDWAAQWGGITSIAFQRLDEEESVEALQETVESLDSHVEAGDLEVITPEEMANEYVYE